MKSIYRTEAGKALIRTFYEETLTGYPFIHRLSAETSFGRTVILSAGENKGLPSLLLLHGSGSNSLAWMGEVELLSSSHRVFCLDIPGEPGLSETHRFSTEGTSFTRWLDEVILSLGLVKPVIAGLSLGGWAAIRYAIEHPDRVGGVIALAPTGVVQPRKGFLVRTIISSLQGEKGIRKLLSVMFDGQEVSEEVVRFQLLLMKHFLFRTDSPQTFTDDEIRSIEFPLVFAIGRKDYIFDGEKAWDRMRRLNPAIHSHLLEKGHALTAVSPYLNLLTGRMS